MSNRKVRTTSEQVEQTAQQDEQFSMPTEDKEAPAADVPACPVIVVSAPQGLNLRKGPHVSYGVMTVLPDGAPVEILDLPLDVEVPGWALVEAGAGVGWVNTNFLREAEI